MLRRSRKRDFDHSPGSHSLAGGGSNAVKRRRLLPSPMSISSAPREQRTHTSPPSSSAKSARSAPGRVETQKSLVPVGEGTAIQIKPELESLLRPNGKSGEEIGASCPVTHWAATGLWPPNFATMTRQGQIDSPRKRSASSSSYSQSVKDGAAPAAHSLPYEKVLAANGVFMDRRGESLARSESKTFCQQLLQMSYPDPVHTPFPLSEFAAVLERAGSRNEMRVRRDITPILVPSPELLSICGAPGLEDIVEELDVEWTKVGTLGGPKPKPDLAIGISSAGFDEAEVAKLQNHKAPERPVLFTDNLCFPFLLCEMKHGEVLDRADRQNMHSSSLAVKAVVELVRAQDESEADKLSGQILVFSLSHDHESVKLYGHFPIRQGGKTTFYRHYIASVDLVLSGLEGARKVRNFVSAIYDLFLPQHLERIRSVLAKMEDPREDAPSLVQDLESEPAAAAAGAVAAGAAAAGAVADFSAPWQSRTTTTSTSSEFKLPGAPASKRQKGELALMRELFAEQQKRSDEQIAFLRNQVEALTKTQGMGKGSLD